MIPMFYIAVDKVLGRQGKGKQAASRTEPATKEDVASK